MKLTNTLINGVQNLEYRTVVESWLVLFSYSSWLTHRDTRHARDTWMHMNENAYEWPNKYTGLLFRENYCTSYGKQNYHTFDNCSLPTKWHMFEFETCFFRILGYKLFLIIKKYFSESIVFRQCLNSASTACIFRN